MQYARVEFGENSVPRSQKYGDIYYSVEDGTRESHYVFLEGNQLSDRWRGQKLFTIGEIGFGTGLNFLNTWKLWRKSAQPPHNLHFLSCENNPLHPRDLERAIGHYPDLKSFLPLLLEQLPDPFPGFHRLNFEEGKVRLTLLYGEALENLQNLNAKVDAWYLDGFAPKINGDCWTQELFQTIGQKTQAKGTFATYSSAGRVRKGLAAVGFEVEKGKGFGQKREMLRGSLMEAPPLALIPRPGLDYPSPPMIRRKKAMVIGAGLAGCSTAYALAQRGWEISLYDRRVQVADEASGNRAGILFPRFNAELDTLGRFFWSGWTHSLQLWKALTRTGKNITGEQPGFLLLEQKKDDTLRFDNISKTLDLPEEVLSRVTETEASKLSGIPLTRGGLYLKKGTWISPVDFCQALVRHPRIKVILGREIDRVEYSEDQWKIFGKELSALDDAPVLILTNAHEVSRFEPTRYLKLETIRGQVTQLPSAGNLTGLKTILSYGGYALLGKDGFLTLGATFDRKYHNLKLCDEEHRQNLALLKQFAPNLSIPEDFSKLSGRVSLRTVTRDRWPVVGPVPVEDTFYKDFEDLRYGRQKVYPPTRFHRGLYVNVAHGSKGLLSAPLSSELLASHLNDEPFNLETPMVEAMHPSRFIIKKLVRGLVQ